MTAADRAAGKQRGKPFQPGQSGNPSGRPAGSRNATTLALEALFDGEADAISRKAIELAKAGDAAMIRLCVDRLLPVRRDRPVAFKLPPIEKPADAADAAAAILAAVAAGEVTPMEAAELTKLLDNVTSIIQARDFEARLEALERARS